MSSFPPLRMPHTVQPTAPARPSLSWQVMIVGFAIASLMLAGVAWTTFERMRDLREATESVQHTLQVRTEAEALLSVLKDAETGERGYVITGLPAYLEPYETALTRVAAGADRLRALVGANATQQESLAALDALIARKVAELRETVAVRQARGFDAAARLVDMGEGKRVMDEIRATVGAIDAEEVRLLAQRRAAQEQHARSAVILSLGGLAAGVGLLILATLLMARAVRQRERERTARTTADSVAAAVRQSEERLRVTIASIGDAVITTDNRGRVTGLNAVAAALTGWNDAEAADRPLDEIFVIVKEESRQPAANPVESVLREGSIASLANHTLLISRNGREIPIDDSAAPIRMADGTIVGVVLVFRDIAERRRGEQERAALLDKERAARSQAEDVARELSRLARDLRATQERVTQLIESMPGVVWEAWGEPDAAAQRMNFVSRYVEAMLGYAVDEWLRTPNFWLSIVHPEDRDEAVHVARDTFETGQPRVNQFRWIAKDGRVLWVESRSTVIIDEHGRAAGMRGVTFDISDRKQAETMLALAKRQAEEANRLKDEFLAMVSHELRTPLNAILGWAGMLQSGVLPEDRRERAVTAIYTSAKREGQLIAELLDVSRIMSGKLKLERGAMDLPEAVNAAIEVVQASADAKRIHLTADIDPAVGTFYGDAPRLQQVLLNLLSNAVKFTPDEGFIEVRVCPAGSDVELTVKDNGQGIAPHILRSIFEPFQQADGSTTRRHGGLGLGLSIVRHLVEAHGGTVRAESAGEGQGATFIVRMPLSDGSADRAGSGGAIRAVQEDAAADAPGTSLDGVSVLVVDDDAESRELVTAALESSGATVITAGSAAAALDVISTRRADVLLADIAMPGEDGYSLIRKIREREAAGMAALPAAALTSLARDEDRQHALQAGFQLHLAKPMDSRALIEAVAILVSREHAP